MKHIFSITTILFSLIMAALLVTALSGCSDDTFDRTGTESPDGPVVKAYLSLSVNDFSVASEGTRTEYPNETDKETATEDEIRIENIWVFQFGDDGNQLIAPYYYKITEQEQLENLDKVEVLLKEGVSSTVFVVANTGDPDWAKGDGFNTLEGLKGKALSNPESIIISPSFQHPRIPMAGIFSDVTVSDGSIINVPVSRMFAKLMISFDNLPNGMIPYAIEIRNIPKYCQINTLGEGVQEENPANYELCKEWVSRTINPTANGEDTNPYVKGKVYAFYIPENLQGEKGTSTDNKASITTGNATERVPDHALVIDLQMRYIDPDNPNGTATTLKYSVYPGGNIQNNFNVRRNCVYRVKINIQSVGEKIHNPSSNCIVAIPGETISFEPYYRTEKGGDYQEGGVYDFSSYLNPNDPAKTIDRVEIIWQTWNAIGDNSAGNLVQFIPAADPKDAIHSEIIVKTKKEGNALIAAYNEAGDILWSWHIWITAKNPGNISNAVVYTTYAWEPDKSATEKGRIKNNEPRVEGYAIMPCNLGALANDPEAPLDPKNTPTIDLAPDDNDIINDIWYCTDKRTYGTLYQWGRKDPFPPLKKAVRAGATYKYDNNVVVVYDNSNQKIIMTTSGNTDNGELFRTVTTYDKTYSSDSPVGSTFESGINYSIKNPTTHISGGKAGAAGSNNSSFYLNGGNWLPVEEGEEHPWSAKNQRLWGAKYISKEAFDSYADALRYSPVTARAIWDNYDHGNGNDKKTIFDPCPDGWRVPPGDLWLGFTNNGFNTGAMNNTSLQTKANVPSFCDQTYIYNNFGFWLGIDGWKKDKYTFFPTQGSREATGQPLWGGICGNYHNATPDLQDKSIQRVNILHLHANGSDMKINTFEDQLVYYNKSVAGPVRCVRDRR